MPGREEALLKKLVERNAGPLTEQAIRTIYREIISASIATEVSLKIAYLGPEVTYTHQAALQHFGSSVTYQPARSIAEIFSLVEHRQAHYGVIPIENSTEGVVVHSFDLLAETNLKIVAQTYLPIEHSLISDSTLDAVKQVYSKDNALGQCRQWLSRHLPYAEWVATESTTQAIQDTKKVPGRAAIAGKLAARWYQVPIIAENIQDKTDNVTRFLIIGKAEQNPSKPLGSGHDKSSYLFSLHDKPGALQHALQPFSKQSLNLSKIESRPSRKKPWDYYFFIDVIGHHQDPAMEQALAELKPLCAFVKWLGSYPNTTPVP